MKALLALLLFVHADCVQVSQAIALRAAISVTRASY